MLRWFDENTADSAALPAISRYVAYSEYTYSAKLRKHTGVSFREYLERQRVSKASEAVGSADKMLIGIALDCGFTLDGAFLSELEGSKGGAVIYKDTEEL